MDFWVTNHVNVAAAQTPSGHSFLRINQAKLTPLNPYRMNIPG